jgi:predicted permease
MSWLRVLGCRIRGLFVKRRLERDLDDELRAHIEMLTEENLRKGMSSGEARYAAQRAFGGIEQAKEIYRERRGLPLVETLLRDVLYALRSLRKSPGFTAIAVLTLALGIGANTAIFSVVNAVLLRPLPYQDPDRLMMLRETDSRQNVDHDGSTSYRDFELWKVQNRTFEDMTIFYKSGWGVQTLTGGGEPEKVQGAFVAANFFSMLGVAPALGRAISPEEVEHRERVVVLSDGLWQRRFGASPQAVGMNLEVEGAKWRVIGVMPSRFQFPFLDVQFWAPIKSHPEWLDNKGQESPSNDRWMVTGRLKPNVMLPKAQAEMTTIANRVEHEYRKRAPTEIPELQLKGLDVRVIPLSEHIVGNVRRALSVLVGAVLFVLLIGCTNLANLFLARGASRSREFAVRAAMGAGRWRLIFQLLTESVTLALIGAAAAVPVATVVIRGLKAFGPEDIPRLAETSIDGAVLVFTIAISLTAGFLFGLAPAWRVSRNDPNETLKEGGRSASAGRSGRRAHALLVTAEFAMAVILLTGAGLLIRSFLAVLAVDPGFRPEHVLTLYIEFPDSMTQTRQEAFYRRVFERVAALPGVQSAGAISNLFFLNDARTWGLRQVEGRPPEPVGRWTQLMWTQISGDYFRAMGIPLLKGRYFTERDGPESPPVAIVSQTLARRYWPGEDAVGKRLKGFDPRGRNDEWVTVVAVVGDTHSYGLERQPISQIYELGSQRHENTPNLLVRTASDPARLATAVRAAVRAVDYTAVISKIKTMEQRLGEQTARRRFQTWLLGVFSSLALALAAIGIFGVMHYSVAYRTHEIGVRMALGARAMDVFGMVIRQGLLLAGIGVALGILGALWLTQALSGMLYGVTARDPVTFAAVALVLLATALAACYIPARRATRVDPMVALRCE